MNLFICNVVIGEVYRMRIINYVMCSVEVERGKTACRFTG